METNDTLIVSICSNHKLMGDKVTVYDSQWNISNSLNKKLIEDLYRNRNRVFQIIRKDRITRQGRYIDELGYNINLNDGPDINHGLNMVGDYMPAICRYNGRFFKALGLTAEERYSVISEHNIHIIFLSGLYGILSSLENIQCYSLHISDSKKIKSIWKSSHLLTHIIMEYMHSKELVNIIDFTADPDYYSLINWKTLHDNVKGKVLHGYSKQFGGVDALETFGGVTREIIKNNTIDIKENGENNLQFISKNKLLNEDIEFVSGLKEFEERDYVFNSRFELTDEEIVIRMVININLYILHVCKINRIDNKNNNGKNKYLGELIEKLNRMKKLSDDSRKSLMEYLLLCRNKVIHENYTLKSGEYGVLKYHYEKALAELREIVKDIDLQLYPIKYG